MPKNKSRAAWLRDWINRIDGNSIYTTDGKIIFCQACGQQKMEQIKKEFSNAYFWLSVDETTDKQGRSIANLLIGKLDGSKWHPPRLISVKPLEKVDYASIARFVNEGLEYFELNREKALLAVTDGAAYMKKSVKHLKVFYANLLHLTCLAHGLHRVAEKIRDLFPGPDKLIAKTKMIFAKAPSRIRRFRDQFSDISLPPKPVLTRWGTWISAVTYYNQYFESIKTIVNSFDPMDAACIREGIECFTDSVWQDLAYVHSNFGGLDEAITKLEKQGLSIHESLEIFANVRNRMDSAIGEKSIEIKQKFTSIVAKNPGIESIAQFCQILSGEHVETNVPINLIPFYKFAPLTSCDVERSFSIYKSTLSDNRMSFTMKNLEMYLIVNCNQE